MLSAKIVSMSNPDTQIILEHFDDKFSQLIESMDVMIDKKLKPVADDVKDLKSDVAVIKLAVKDTNKDLLHLDQRVEKLETT